MTIGSKLSAWLGARPRVETFEDQIYDALIMPGDVCYDVGANRGDMTERMARLAGRAGLVVAFEPVWPQYRALCGRLRKLSRHAAPVLPVPCGLAEADRMADVQVPAGDFGQGSIASVTTWQAAHPGATMQAYRCRLLALDGLLQDSALPRPAFAKIDVEGAELFVLRGAASLLADGAAPLMLIELFAPWQRALGYGPWDALSLLAGRGYEFLFACPDGLVAHRPSAERPFPDGYEHGYNVLAHVPTLHDARTARLAPLHRGAGGRVLPMAPAPLPNRP